MTFKIRKMRADKIRRLYNNGGRKESKWGVIHTQILKLGVNKAIKVKLSEPVKSLSNVIRNYEHAIGYGRGKKFSVLRQNRDCTIWAIHRIR